MSININIPYVPQGKKSANCGPCSIKMIADYYGINKENGPSYSVPSLNRLLKVSTKWGCEKSDMARVLNKLGLKRERVQLSNLRKHLKNQTPILTLLVDESNEGHYAIIKGQDKNQIIFNDSYWGKDFKRDSRFVKERIKKFDDWMWAISPATKH